LRDVLGYHAAEVAEILDTTVESVTSALKRARASLRRYRTNREAAPSAGSPAEQELVSQLVRAHQTGDVEALTTLLTDDVVISMPPVPLEYHGRELAARFVAAVTFRHGRTYDLVPTRANGQPARSAPTTHCGRPPTRFSTESASPGNTPLTCTSGERRAHNSCSATPTTTAPIDRTRLTAQHTW
jgi:hypothetical protein